MCVKIHPVKYYMIRKDYQEVLSRTTEFQERRTCLQITVMKKWKYLSIICFIFIGQRCRHLSPSILKAIDKTYKFVLWIIELRLLLLELTRILTTLRNNAERTVGRVFCDTSCVRTEFLDSDFFSLSYVSSTFFPLYILTRIVLYFLSHSVGQETLLLLCVSLVWRSIMRHGSEWTTFFFSLCWEMKEKISLIVSESKCVFVQTFQLLCIRVTTDFPSCSSVEVRICSCLRLELLLENAVGMSRYVSDRMCVSSYLYYHDHLRVIKGDLRDRFLIYVRIQVYDDQYIYVQLDMYLRKRVCAHLSLYVYTITHIFLCAHLLENDSMMNLGEKSLLQL